MSEKLQTKGTLLRRLTGATFNYGLGSILPKVIGFLLIPVYTAFLTPEDYGILELASALGGFILLFMRFGLPGAVTRFYFDYGEGEQLRDYVTTIFWFVIGTSLVVGVLVLLTTPWLLERLLPGLPYFPYVLLLVFAGFFSGNSDLQRRLIQTREQSSYSAKLSIAMSLVTISLALTFIIGFGMGAEGVFLASAISAVLFFGQAFYYLWPELSGTFRKVMLWSSLGYAFGLLPTHFINSITPLVTRSLLANYDSVAAVGLFGLALRFTNALELLVYAFSNAYTPVYFSIRKEGKRGGLTEIAQVASTIWFIAVLGFLMVALLGPPAVLLLTPEAYHLAAPLIPVLALVSLARTIFTLTGAEIFYSKKTWLVPILFVSSAGVNILITVLTVEAQGAFGLAWAMVVGIWTLALVGTFFSRMLVKSPFDWLSFVRLAVLGGAALTTSMLVEAANPWVQVVLSISILAGFIVLLWLSGDPTLRKAKEYLVSIRRPVRKT